MDQMKIGAFLKTLRKEKGRTQEQLAEQLHVSGRTVSRWETGNNMPDISGLMEIAEFYEVSIPELIDGERKSGEMKEEVREEIRDVADRMADYAGTEKTAIVKNIRNHSLFGVCALAVLIILEVFVPEGTSVIADRIHMYCETLIYVMTIMIFLIATGLIHKFQRKKRDIDLPKPVLYLIAAVLAMTIAYTLKLLISLIAG